MSNKSVEWYLLNGCELCSPSLEMFILVYAATGGNPCNGCNCKGTCKAWSLINHPAAKLHPTKKVETNADIAERLNISKRQVAKMRREGTL